MKRFKELFIGDKNFYRMVLIIAVPIMIQSGITNLVGLLDNIMVGQLGTGTMSGVAISNQLLGIFQLCVFGVVSAASIFGAQFYGQGNLEGFCNSFRIKCYGCFILTAIGVLLFLTRGAALIGTFLMGEGGQDLAVAHQVGVEYLLVMLIGLLPYAVTQVYASALREAGETVLPMVAGIIAVFLNLGLNYVFIFGNFGAPRLGAVGAACATVVARFIEAFIVIYFTHAHKDKYPYMQGIYKTLRVPMTLVGNTCRKGLPLFMNEFMWSSGMAVLAQSYSLRGIDAVAAYNISSTVSNLFNIVFMALGSSIGVVVGQLLGAGKMQEAVDKDRKMIFFSVASCVVIGGVMLTVAPAFPSIYNTTETVKNLATNLLRISAAFMPLYAFYHASYFTMRSGGKTLITFLFDSCFLWAVNIPAAFYMSRFTAFPLIQIYLICQMLEIIKGIVAFILIKKKVWVNNMVQQL